MFSLRLAAADRFFFLMISCFGCCGGHGTIPTGATTMAMSAVNVDLWVHRSSDEVEKEKGGREIGRAHV